MNGHYLKGLGTVLAGALTGGVMGYLIGELAADKVYNQRLEEEAVEWEEREEMAEEEKDDPNAVPLKRPLDYRRFSMDKGELGKLAARYETPSNGGLSQIVLTEPEWNVARTKYETRVINFWDEDQVYSFEDGEEVVENVVDHLGPNPHLHFGESDDADPDVLYILNEKEKIAYDVTRIHGSYAVTVKGEKPKAVKKSAGKQKKVTNDEEKEGDD